MRPITAKQYRQIEEAFPVQRGNVSVSNLTILNAILYVAESGCKWRQLPKKFGKWDTVYMRMRRWASQPLQRVRATLSPPRHPTTLHSNYITPQPATKPERIIAMEASLEAPIVDPATGNELGVPLFGVIDLVLEEDDVPVVVDFKTAASASDSVSPEFAPAHSGSELTIQSPKTLGVAASRLLLFFS